MSELKPGKPTGPIHKFISPIQIVNHIMNVRLERSWAQVCNLATHEAPFLGCFMYIFIGSV